MDKTTDNDGSLLARFPFLGVWPILLILFVWFICAAVAGFIADHRDRSGFGFFMATFFFLGPLGVGVALLATRGELDRLPPAPTRKVAEGRQRFTCPRCGAGSDIPDKDTSYECWQCGEVLKVKPKATADSTGQRPKPNARDER
jgi:ribosomal protein S27AE